MGRKRSGPDPVKILNKLGAQWSPDLDAYASGQLPAHKIRCVLCGCAPCECRYCDAQEENIYQLPNRPPTWQCGMRIDPASGECPRGHH